MTMRHKCSAGLFVLISTIAVRADAQTKPSDADPSLSAPKATKINSADTQFLEKASQGGIAEIQLGKLALEKAATPAVKDFAQRMLVDHSKLADEIKQLASQKSVAIPEMDDSSKALYDRLAKLSPADFDREYAAVMVNNHESDVAQFRRETQEGKDRDVREFANRAMPILENHWSMARQLKASVGESSQK